MNKKDNAKSARVTDALLNYGVQPLCMAPRMPAIPCSAALHVALCSASRPCALRRARRQAAAQMRRPAPHAETVKYFNNEALEVANLGVAVSEYQDIEFKLMASLAALNVLQSGIIFVGLSAGLIFCVKVRSTWQARQQLCPPPPPPPPVLSSRACRAWPTAA